MTAQEAGLAREESPRAVINTISNPDLAYEGHANALRRLHALTKATGSRKVSRHVVKHPLIRIVLAPLLAHNVGQLGFPSKHEPPMSLLSSTWALCFLQ